jgi:hypothetical protein
MPMYKGETLVQILLAHQQAPIPSLCKARSDVPPQLDAVFQKMVAKKPEDRYQTMTEVITALETCVGKRAATATAVGGGPPPLPRWKIFLFARGFPTRRGDGCQEEGREVLLKRPSRNKRRLRKPANNSPATRGYWRYGGRRKRLFVAIGCGLLGVMGMIALAITIRVRHPDGEETSVTVPNGSKVTVSEKGDVDVSTAGQGIRGLGIRD